MCESAFSLRDAGADLSRPKKPELPTALLRAAGAIAHRISIAAWTLEYRLEERRYWGAGKRKEY